MPQSLHSLFTDSFRSENDDAPDWLQETLKPNVFKEVVDKGKLKAPGIIAVQRRLLVIFPRGIDCDTLTFSDKFHSALYLLHSLKRYSEKPNESTTSERNEDILCIGDKNGQSAIDVLEAMLFLWNDYIKSGPLIITELIRKKNGRGRINWNRTLRQPRTLATSSYLPYTQTSIICPTQVTERVECNPQHPITLLHKYTCHFIAHQLGHQTTPDLPLHLSPKQILKTYHGRMSTDRQRKVYGWLKKFYYAQSTSQNSDNLKLYIAKGFAHVWEEMCRFALQGKRETFHTTFHNSDGTHAHSPRNLDIYLEEDDCLYILDAKYKEKDSLSDLYKQIFYGYYFNKIHNNNEVDTDKRKKRIYNGFLLPSVETTNAYTIHSFNFDPNLFNDCGDIVHLKVNTRKILQIYAQGKVNPVFRHTLLDCIQNTQFESFQAWGSDTCEHKIFEYIRHTKYLIFQGNNLTFKKCRLREVHLQDVRDFVFEDCSFDILNILDNQEQNSHVSFKNCKFKVCIFEHQNTLNLDNITFKNCTVVEMPNFPLPKGLKLVE